MADLSDAAILRHVEDALREVGEGRASLSSAGERLMYRILDLPYPVCGSTVLPESLAAAVKRDGVAG